MGWQVFAPERPKLFANLAFCRIAVLIEGFEKLENVREALTPYA
jgi:hypothetical protein